MPNKSLRRLTTKTFPKIQVNDWRWKFYKSDTVEEIPFSRSAIKYEGNTARGPTINIRGKFRTRSEHTIHRWKSRYRSDEHCSTKKTLLHFATNSVLLQFILYLYFHKSKIEYDKGRSYSGGALSQRRIIFAGVNLSQFLWFSNIWISLLQQFFNRDWKFARI